jgi:hypothetical protein
MPLYERSKGRDPTPKEQANWDRLFSAEKESQRKKRQQRPGRFGNDAEKRSFLDRFRSPF